MTRRVLIVAPAFPPHPSPATHRARFLAQYGPEHGWDVEVLTLDPAGYEEALDRELEALVAPTTRVTRVAAIDARSSRRFGVGDLGLRAYLPMRRNLMARSAVDRPDVVFIPGGPFYTFWLGAEFRRRFGVPYVIDYTDPWVPPDEATSTGPLAKSYWSRRLAEWLEPGVARGASHILAVSDGIIEAIRARYPDVPRSRCEALPFGFEPEDFARVRLSNRPNAIWDPQDGRLHLAYVGVVWNQAVEPLRALFAAVRTLVAREPERREALRLHFVGTSYDPRATDGPVLRIAAEQGVADMVTEHVRRVPYFDAIRLLTQADGLIGLGGMDPNYTASKIFPCILARRPLLALYHRASSVCDIVRDVSGIELVTFDERNPPATRVSEIAAALRAIVDGAAEPQAVDSAALDSLTARAISARIYGIFDRVVDEGERWTAEVVA